MRLAAPADAADGLAALLRAAFRGEAASPWSADAIRSSVAAGAVVFADAPDAPSAASILRVVGDEAELLTLGVAPARRRRGLGAALLVETEAFARTSGAAAIHLEVAASNAAALALYDRAGYRPAGLRRDYYGRGADALRLSKPL